MNLLSVITINIYSIILLTILGLQTIKHSERKSRQYKLYMALLQATVLLLIVDVLGRFDGNADLIYFMVNQLGNFLLYLINPIVSSLWILYVYFQFYHDTTYLKMPLYLIVTGNFLNLVLLISSQFFGWYYYIDANNIYHRGPLFWVSFCISLIFILCAFFIIVRNRKEVEKNVYHALLFFAVPPLIGMFLQTVFYGTSLIPTSITISLLVVFLNIQNRNIYSDYLTDVHNRRKLDLYLQDKVEKCKKNQAFSAILLDFNDFKEINDTFGHQMGDDALVTAVNLMKNCLRPNDFLSRYGGDEFCIVLDISNEEELEKVIDRISEHVEKYNKEEIKPYKISFSMGYGVYDRDSDIGIKEFQKDIDKRMYQAKDKKQRFI